MNDNIICDQQKTQQRIEICIECENNVVDVIPKCKECDCSISMITTLTFKSCPLGKW